MFFNTLVNLLNLKVSIKISVIKSSEGQINDHTHTKLLRA